jgi:Glycoside hydrolase family 44
MRRRPRAIAWACAPRGWTLALVVAAGCIQRRLDCPPVTGPAAGGSVVGTGVNLIGQGGLSAFALSGDAHKVVLSRVAVHGQAFGEALRADVKEPSQSEYSVQLRAVTTGAVDEGDALLATFFVRAEKPNEDLGVVETQFVFELARDPYDKSVTYDVQAGPEWREVHVPFVAKRAFAAGDAQIVFRLGYDPQTIDLGGVTVENFSKKAKLAQLPTTRRWTPPKRPDLLAPTDGGPMPVAIDPGKVVGPISPYVYGVNSQRVDGPGVTVRRMGGNRQTAYNWEINASNAGSDYHHQSDEWACTALGYKNCGDPAAQFLDFAAENRRLGIETLATIPMIDYVTGDKGGEVSEAEKAPSKRWVRSSPHKNTPFAAEPDRRDGVVYEDEFVDYIVRKAGKASSGGVRFYSLDNEPALWPSTHPRVHPEKTTYREMVTRTEALASQITAIDPGAVVLGGVMYGWGEFTTLQGAPDAKEHNAGYGTYVDFFLAAMKELEQKYARRLVHVLDVHWYPEARGTKRVTEDDVSPKTVEARLQAPRALWDPTYREKTWIDAELGKPIELVVWLKETIAKRYPGTKVSMTEYNFGAPDHISGGLAQTDVLGVLGREGVYLANYWGNGAGNGVLPSYIAAAFKLYRDFDGKGGTYGDTAVTASVPDAAKASAYAATDSKRPRLLTIVVINKDQRASYTGHFTIRGPAQYALEQAYRLDHTAPRVQPAFDKAVIRDNRLEYVLPPLSATLFVCEKQ